MGHPEAPPPELIAKAMLEMKSKEHARIAWTVRHGHIRPCISTDNWGKKIVAVGNRILAVNDCKFVTDFLLKYVPTVFGKEWWDAEVQKPEAQRHPVFQWRTGCLRHKQISPVEADGKHIVALDGNSAAYLSFAFSLFAIEDNGRLDGLLLQRLKHPDQFQGAWHETFVEATCLRAGFLIERENENDPSTRHAEFTAVHKAIGVKFSIEAKSKHRPGVLGFAGDVQPDDELSFAFGRLINAAIAKKPQHPLVIFLDTNLPFHVAQYVYSNLEGSGSMAPSPFLKELFERIRAAHGGGYPFVMIAFTNNPDHYVAPHEPDPPKHIHVLMTAHPDGASGKALNALYEAVPLYGNIPNEFPDFL